MQEEQNVNSKISTKSLLLFRTFVVLLGVLGHTHSLNQAGKQEPKLKGQKRQI